MTTLVNTLDQFPGKEAFLILVAFLYNLGKLPLIHKKADPEGVLEALNGKKYTHNGIDSNDIIKIVKIVCKICNYMSVYVCPLVNGEKA